MYLIIRHCQGVFLVFCNLQNVEADQLPSLRELHRKAGSLEELGAQKLNSQQREAVAAVLVGAGGGRHPLTLFGPPGTGKTVTLVECALQVGLSFVAKKPTSSINPTGI